jgi:hypothetical protein
MDVRSHLASPFHERLLGKTHDSIVSRLQPDGYFPESLTGAYPGMFPRTVCALVRMLLATDNHELVNRPIQYCLQAMSDENMRYMPHVIGPAREGKIPVIDSEDQIDGQAHVILAWALAARDMGPTPYEDATYRTVAQLMDASTARPYLFPETGWPIHPGLVQNFNLEHSRDGQFWHAYDFLTQSFIASALENMIVIADRRQDENHKSLWAERLDFLNRRIAENMTRLFDGKTIYLEMRLPTGNATEAWPGLGWINLAPIPSGWKSVDRAVFKNTIDAWHRVAEIEWDGPRIYSCDWLPEGMTDKSGRQSSRQIITKALGWDLLFCMEFGEYDRVCEMLDFIERLNEPELVAEAFSLPPDSKKWALNDPGNGEQACWWTWAMVECRKKAGLPGLPCGPNETESPLGAETRLSPGQR